MCIKLINLCEVYKQKLLFEGRVGPVAAAGVGGGGGVPLLRAGPRSSNM